MPAQAVCDDAGPDQIAVAAYDRMRRAVLGDFIRKQGGVDAAEYHPGASLSQRPPDLITAQGVARVNADADDVSGVDGAHIEWIEGLIDDLRFAPVAAGRGCQYV